MTKIVELRPTRDLLNNSFEKYQFYDINTPIDSHALSTPVFRKEISADQNSLLEAQIFAYHNHLFTNIYDDSCWFVDSENQLWRFFNNELKCIYKLKSDFKDSVYNPSIAFTSNNMISILNGNKTLETLILTNNEVNNSFIFTDIDPGVILDMRYVKEESIIIVAIQGVVEVEVKKQSQVTLYTFSCKTNDTFSYISKQVLRINGSVEYLYIEENGKFIQIASEKEVSFESDSSKPVENNDCPVAESKETVTPKYSWTQDEETLTLWVKIPENLRSTKETIKVTMNTIVISVGDDILLQGNFSQHVDPDLTTWSNKQDLLEIDLTKQSTGVLWTELLANDKTGEYLPNKALAAEIHSRLSHLCTEQQEKDGGASAIGFNAEQLEDCDLEGKENLMQRINLSTHQQTHLVMIRQSNCIIFSQKLKNKQAVCMRHDHAGCIWFFGNGDEEHWPKEHKFTFPGFGYIEASKKSRKFCLFSPDGSYIAILEHLRHIFIYEKTKNDAKVGKQRIIDIDTELPILGACIIKNNLFVLTTNTLYQLTIAL